jgi:exonuclease III
MDLTDIYRIFHPKAAEYTFFSVTRGTFSKIDHILGHKGSLNKYKQIEITACMLSEDNTIKEELNNKRSSKKFSNS